ncbi:MAG TPA: hypothetical protein VGJ13_09145 [Pseudonocardiaceae bacterium]|jgi:hypothetical protein
MRGFILGIGVLLVVAAALGGPVTVADVDHVSAIDHGSAVDHGSALIPIGCAEGRLSCGPQGVRGAADGVRGISVPLLGVGVMVGAAAGAGAIAWREARR